MRFQVVFHGEIQGFIESIWNFVKGVFVGAWAFVIYLTDAIKDWVQRGAEFVVWLGTLIGGAWDAFGIWLSDIFAAFWDWLSKIGPAFWDLLTAGIVKLGEYMGALGTLLGRWFDALGDYLAEVGTAFIEVYRVVADFIGTLVTDYWEVFLIAVIGIGIFFLGGIGALVVRGLIYLFRSVPFLAGIGAALGFAATTGGAIIAASTTATLLRWGLVVALFGFIVLYLVNNVLLTALLPTPDTPIYNFFYGVTEVFVDDKRIARTNALAALSWISATTHMFAFDIAITVYIQVLVAVFILRRVRLVLSFN